MEQFIHDLANIFKKPNNALIALDSSILNDDMLIEVLIRLPLKSLIKFKSVCKSWHDLISHEKFLQRLPLIKSMVYYHMNTSSQTRELRYACTTSSNSNHTLAHCNIDFFPYHQNSTIIDCCNGLVLCHTSLFTTFFVINPSVRRWSTIPKSNKRALISILAFDPSHSMEFKVISFTSWLTQGVELEVFSSLTCDWVEHKVQWSARVEASALSSTMTYFCGKLYILCNPNHILCIDLSPTTNDDDNCISCDLIELPKLARSEGSLARCNGSPHYIHSDDHGDGQFKVWMLDGTSKSDYNWVLKHSLNMRNINISVNINHVCGHEKSFWTRSKSRKYLALDDVKVLDLDPMLDGVAYLCLKGRILVSYDLNKNKVDEVFECGNGKEDDHLVKMSIFPFSHYLIDSLSKSNVKII